MVNKPFSKSWKGHVCQCVVITKELVVSAMEGISGRTRSNWAQNQGLSRVHVNFTKAVIPPTWLLSIVMYVLYLVLISRNCDMPTRLPRQGCQATVPLSPFPQL